LTFIGSGYCLSQPVNTRNILIRETDGSPSGYLRKLYVTNTTLTKNSSGNFTLDSGSGGAVEGTEVLSTGEGGGTKYLREDGDGTSSWQTPAGSGDLLADGTTPMTADWDIGNFDITVKSLTGDGTIEGAALTEGGEAVYNSTETPGGELGGSWASPTIDDSVAVTGWTLTTPTLTTSLTTDSKTISEAEIGRLDALTGVIVTDATAVTDLEGTGLSIGAGVLNWAAASTDLSDTADLLYETELSNITELQAQIEDVSLILNNATSFGGDVSGTYDALVLGSDVANGTNIADNSTDSEHYVDGSIDIEHFGADTRRIGFVVINLENTTDFAFYKTPETITIANVSFVNTLGNVTGTLSECDSNGTSCVDVDADWTIGNTSNFTDSSFTNDEIDAGDWLRWNTTSTEENTTILTGTIRF